MNQTSTDAQNEAPTTVRTRRNFLRDLTLGSVAAAAAVTVVVPKAEAADPVPTTDHTGQVKVFRFSTRNNVSCRACRLHHRYMVFRSRKVARKNRAHPGCDCRIEPQWLERKTFRALFKVNGVTLDVVNLKPAGPRF